ncbi:hypothetical protein SUDANB145_01150 [Streptomyces sp. enrichment culture]
MSDQVARALRTMTDGELGTLGSALFSLQELNGRLHPVIG